MTLAMERFHGGPVQLIVAARRDCDDGRYAREILLTGPDGRIVQYGIVRIALDRLPIATATAIRLESEPLGRILTSAGLLCDVHDVHVLRVVSGPDFASIMGSPDGAETFGRVATIRLDSQPIIELLEIVAPATAGS
jgi:chorismate-pyruvate lyase